MKTIIIMSIIAVLLGIIGFIFGYITKPHYVGKLIKTQGSDDWGDLYFVEFESEEERQNVERYKEIRLKVEDSR